jgi:branched-chain amino acid transport system permease protein
MYVCLVLFAAFGLDPYVSLFVTVPLLFGIGFFLFKFMFRRVLKSEILMVVQLTLGMVFIIENGILMVFGPDFRNVPNFLSPFILTMGR